MPPTLQPDPFAASFSRPTLEQSLSSDSTSSYNSSISTPATSISPSSLPTSPALYSATCPPMDTLAPSPPSLAAEPLSPANMSRPLASAAPIHSFPVFFLSLLTALEADPASVRNHLGNLQRSYAAPAIFSPIPEGKPAETDAIVASLSRIADRLRSNEGTGAIGKEGQREPEKPEEDEEPGSELEAVKSRPSTAPMSRTTSPRRPTVAGETVEEVRKNCEDQILALKVLHAEELHRSQLTHDNEVR
ncbi:hypothetical protein JCM11641_003826, partial [Rhodosporidiobolus odoratus]